MTTTLPATWHDDAACLTVGPALFEPDGYGPTYRATIADAKKVCADCPVRQQCLDEAIADDDQHTIRGGLTPPERRRRGGTRAPTPLQPCGTPAAYARHLAAREEPCTDCKAANAARHAAMYARKKGRTA